MRATILSLIEVGTFFSSNLLKSKREEDLCALPNVPNLGELSSYLAVEDKWCWLRGWLVNARAEIWEGAVAVGGSEKLRYEHRTP